MPYIGFDPNSPGGAVEAAQGYADQAQIVLEAINGTFYGTAASDPSLDPNGNAPTEGDTYFNSTTKVLMVREGGVWRETRADYTSTANAVGAGTGDACTASLTPAPGSYTHLLAARIEWPGANSVTTPTINLNGLGVKTICKGNNQALAAGDIPGAGYMADLVYSTTYGKFILLNPVVAPQPFVGKQTMWIPAAAMLPRTTNGPAYGYVETTTNKIILRTLDFDAATAEYAQFQVRMPKSWNEGTVTAYFVWSNASGAGSVVWALRAVAISDGDVLDAAFGTAVTVTDSVTTAGDLMQTSETGAMTIAGTPALGDLVTFEVYRNATSGSDTLAVDARLSGVVIIYTMDAATDA